MEVELILKFLVLVVGFYMAWNIGANDVSNAMGTSVGSGALSLRRAVLLAAIFEFGGAFLAGENVSETMQSGLIDTTLFITQPKILVLGMCGALLGTGIWLQIASYFGWPVSTTHAIVGAILGFGAIIGGIDAVQWHDVGSIALSWVISPLISAFISYILFGILQRKVLFAIDPAEATKKLMPYLIGVVLGTFTLSLIFNGLHNYNLCPTPLHTVVYTLSIAFMGWLVTYFILKRTPLPDIDNPPPSRNLPQHVVSLQKALKHLERVHVSSFDAVHAQVGQIVHDVKNLADSIRTETHFSDRTSEYKTVEKMFVYLQIMSACYVAFAHGANDVANAIGPVAAVLNILDTGLLTETTPVPPWLLALGGLGIVIGLATWGWRVIETIGKKITELTPTRGFCAEFGAATTILVASKLGLPISTTHCLVGAVLGVGLARGMRAINLTMLRDIVLSWVITLPASALMSILGFYALRALFS